MIYNKNGGPSVIRTLDLPIMSSRHSAEPLQQDEEKKEIISRVMVGTTETEPMPNLVVGRSGQGGSKVKIGKGFSKPNSELVPN